jgi:nicotinate phosphoribosyltransferase
MVEPATFSLFTRPASDRPVLLASGLGRAMDVLEAFRYEEPQLESLRSQGTGEETLDWLSRLEVSGELWAVPEGTPVLAHEPLLEFTAPLPVAQLVETALMNALHYETLVATKAARLVRAARGRNVVDFGFRRAPGLESGVRAARAAYVGGCSATSNVEAGRRYDVPISGTMAHSFIQSFDEELDAFRAFARDHPEQAVLLVETYDPIDGVENAIRAARDLASEDISVSAIRIDSDPLDELAVRARGMLDRAGFEDVKVFVSGGLDEERIAAMVDDGTPADGFGVGSALVVSDDKPALDVAYKLVEYAGRGRAKYSENKVTWPGRKQVFRSGHPLGDVLEQRDGEAEGEPLLEPCWRDGRRLVETSAELGRRRAADHLEAVPDEWLLPPGPAEAPTPRIGPHLEREAARVRERILA